MEARDSLPWGLAKFNCTKVGLAFKLALLEFFRGHCQPKSFCNSIIHLLYLYYSLATEMFFCSGYLYDSYDSLCETMQQTCRGSSLYCSFHACKLIAEFQKFQRALPF